MKVQELHMENWKASTLSFMRWSSPKGIFFVNTPIIGSREKQFESSKTAFFVKNFFCKENRRKNGGSQIISPLKIVDFAGRKINGEL